MRLKCLLMNKQLWPWESCSCLPLTDLVIFIKTVEGFLCLLQTFNIVFLLFPMSQISSPASITWRGQGKSVEFFNNRYIPLKLTLPYSKLTFQSDR